MGPAVGYILGTIELEVAGGSSDLPHSGSHLFTQRRGTFGQVV